MKDYSSAEIVIGDMDYLFNVMMTSRRKQRKFRLSFEQYIVKSQQLTDVMRKEYSRKTDHKWIASDYTGWNENTNILKKLRNVVLHQVPLMFYEVTYSVYPAVQFATEDKDVSLAAKERGFRTSKGVVTVDMPFSEKTEPFSAGWPLKKPVHPEPNHRSNFAYPLKEFISYEIKWSHLSEAGGVLQKGPYDVVKLLLSAHPIYLKYYDYYTVLVKKNAWA